MQTEHAQASDPQPHKFSRRVNVRRGIFRSWIAVSVLWVLGCIGLYLGLGSDPDLANAKFTMIVAFGMPAAVFALGSAIGWVAVGFRPGPRAAISGAEIADRKRARVMTLSVAVLAALSFTALWQYIDREQATLEAVHQAEAQAQRRAEAEAEQRSEAQQEAERKAAVDAEQRRAEAEAEQEKAQRAAEVAARAALARRIAVAKTSLQIIRKDIRCSGSNPCGIYTLTATLRNRSSETITSASLGWVFLGPTETACPSSYETKKISYAHLLPGETTTLRTSFDGPNVDELLIMHDPRSGWGDRYCVGVTGVDILR